ncbi:excitatory amino acid transporter 4 isoform X1 [Selaginella moellendorffii]|uniref:excitatory amino acid transporter 4 isoform X1 n=1 Tax=Selaginella moellendorffii TaxID=88036 RepID=UPI000D1C7956|nr:excitatory amino acid transporter 4 isoform X1 [Selaginella moellendorffii]|eukprot:XP_024525560.1 excitatory amino acid transporter 4 isoform X1 [Selaginella moellendorffii]
MALCRSDTLVWWTLLGVVCGIGLGAALYRAHCSDLTIELIGYPGELYLRALQQLVLPLIVFALMSGVFSLRHTQHGVGRITRWSLFYYLISMLLAVVLGITLVYLIKPGQSRPFSTTNDKCTRNNITITSVSLQENAAATLVEPLLQIGRDLIPTNFVAAAAKSDYLGMVAFAIVFAFFVNTFGEKADSLVQLVELCNAIIMKIIFAVITLTPIGVASLTASALLKACDVFRLLKALGLFVGTVLGGLMLHSLILLPLMVMLLSRRNPFNALKNFFPALIMGLGTSSGAVTMPVTMNCAVASGCDPNLVRFVIPLGTNINRDGSALYEAVSVLFICQVRKKNSVFLRKNSSVFSCPGSWPRFTTREAVCSCDCSNSCSGWLRSGPKFWPTYNDRCSSVDWILPIRGRCFTSLRSGLAAVCRPHFCQHLGRWMCVFDRGCVEQTLRRSKVQSGRD